MTRVKDDARDGCAASLAADGVEAGSDGEGIERGQRQRQPQRVQL